MEQINWAQLITSGGFAALTWYLICIRIPKIEELFGNERNAWATERHNQRADVADERKEWRDAVIALRDAIQAVKGKP